MQQVVHQQDQDFPVLFVVPEQGPGPAAQTVADRLGERGLQIIVARTRDDLRQAATAQAAPAAGPIGTAVVSWDVPGAEAELEARLADIHGLTGQPPVVLLSEGPDEGSVPAPLAGRMTASFWLHADSPHFVADQVEWLVRTYALRSQVVGVLGGDISQYGEIGQPDGGGQADAGDPAGRVGQPCEGRPAG
jgi:Orn/Lys/Arg decarboxylase, N-terminal domain